MFILWPSIAAAVLGARVRKSGAEELRKGLARLGKVDKSHAIVDDGDFVIVPLVGAPPSGMLASGVELVDAEFPRRASRKDPINAVRSEAKVPEDLKLLLPDKWELLGDVLLLRLDPSLDRFEEEVARAYASVLGAKTVLRELGGVSGPFRQPVARKIFGTDTVTTHLENGIKFRFDASRIMYSSGNLDERIHMSTVRCDGETVVDMFAGIGYFSIPLAVYQRPRKIIACEINPDAYEFLKENIVLNGVQGTVVPVLGDNRDLEGRSLADRVIMGYIKTTHEFLPAAMRLLRSGGTLHYHETCPNELLPQRPIERLLANAKGGRVEVLRFRRLKSYAPGVTHVVVDARVFKPF